MPVMDGFWGKVDKFVRGYCNIVGILTPVLVAAIVVFVCIDIVCRSLFNSPINGSIEIVQCLIAAAGFSAMGRTTYSDGHIRIDSLVNALPPKVGLVIDIIMNLLPMTVIPFLVIASFSRFSEALISNEVTTIVQWPMWPFLIIMCIGFVGMFLGQLMVIVRRIKEGVREK